jgi:hypothetical protein
LGVFWIAGALVSHLPYLPTNSINKIKPLFHEPKRRRRKEGEKIKACEV